MRRVGVKVTGGDNNVAGRDERRAARDKLNFRQTRRADHHSTYVFTWWSIIEE